MSGSLEIASAASQRAALCLPAAVKSSPHPTDRGWNPVSSISLYATNRNKYQTEGRALGRITSGQIRRRGSPAAYLSLSLPPATPKSKSHAHPARGGSFPLCIYRREVKVEFSFKSQNLAPLFRFPLSLFSPLPYICKDQNKIFQSGFRVIYFQKLFREETWWHALKDFILALFLHQ
jgi:hypothetical protein